MTAAEQREVLQRAREAGRWPQHEMRRGWESAHGNVRQQKNPPESVVAWACAVVRDVEAFLGERLADRLEIFTRLVNGESYVDEHSRGFWWVVGYCEDLQRAFEAMP